VHKKRLVTWLRNSAEHSPTAPCAHPRLLLLLPVAHLLLLHLLLLLQMVVVIFVWLLLWRSWLSQLPLASQLHQKAAGRMYPP
jgi:hypothetical protein